MADPCPCGSRRDYTDCCGRFHAGAIAPDAETLMRSRYSAYVRGDSAYLLASWHPDTRPDAADLEAARGTRWLGLEVRRHVADGDEARVEFVARYRIGGGPAVRLHEISRFRREQGRWYYLDGDFPEG